MFDFKIKFIFSYFCTLKVYYSLEDFNPLHKTVLTIGTFDGVHVGHLKIIQKLVDTATHKNCESVLLTFFPHPRMVIYPDDHGIKLLNTLDEKIKLLTEAGLQHLIILPFTKEFAKLGALDYIKEIIVDKIQAQLLVIGYDHRFGKNREGNIKTLEAHADEFGFELFEISPADIDEITISSTKIRNYLLDGEVEQAKRLLGKEYTMTGKVKEGRKLGREIGFPTANIEEIPLYKLVPKDGVYAVKVSVNNTMYKGMMNIGNRPTVDGVKHANEVHIFDFNKDIYNQDITVSFVARIRDEQKFSNIEALKTQLVSDKVKALDLLNQS